MFRTRALPKGTIERPIEDFEFHDAMNSKYFRGYWTKCENRTLRMESPSGFCTAVSGGADSLALAALANEWGVRNNIRIAAVTVDHGLRSASKDESLFAIQQLFAMGYEMVSLCTVRWGLSAEALLTGSTTEPDILRKLNIPIGCSMRCDLLRSESEAFQLTSMLPVAPSASYVHVSHEKAREARLEALYSGAMATGTSSVMLAHHAGDQAETVLLRMGRQSHLTGLGAM